MRTASRIRINAHKFSYSLLRRELGRRLVGEDRPEVTLVADDDLWWAGHGDMSTPNTKDEFELVTALQRDGLKVRYMETNGGAHYLHHNKFMVLSTPDGEAAFAGAGNFTGSAFKDNFENFYLIRIPHVVEAMKKQHDHLWDLATPEESLPQTNVAPRE